MNESETRPYVDWQTMQSFMIDALKGYGVPEDDARLCAGVLLESDRRGIESHGCNRLKPIYLDRIENGMQKAVTEIETVKEMPATAVLDAHDGMGMVASKYAMDLAIEKAKKYGISCVVVRNSSHYGIAGYWAMLASRQGLIGITGTNARPSIAPTFGTENMLGTNPLTFALPTDEDFDFVIDCATSITQRGKIEYYARIGKETPAGYVITSDGGTITDSDQILKDLKTGDAALAPLGGIGDEMAGYKGYGYATVVEILSAALAQGAFMHALSGIGDQGQPVPCHLGHFFIVIDPEAFMGKESFKKTAGDICRALRNSRKAPGHDRIWTAGEKEHDIWLERKDKGVPVSAGVQKEMIEVRDKLNLPYHFVFEDEA